MKRGRPRSLDPMRRFDVRLGTADLKRLARIQARDGLDRSKAIRKAIKILDNLLEKAPMPATDPAPAPAPAPPREKPLDEAHPLRGSPSDPIEPCPRCGRRLGRSLHSTPHGKPPGTGGGKCEGVPR